MRPAPLRYSGLFFSVLVAAELVAGCSPTLHLMASRPECPAADTSWLRARGFAQIDRVEEGWLVFVDADGAERGMSRACVAAGVESGAVFRRGVRDTNAENELAASVRGLLDGLERWPPPIGPDRRHDLMEGAR